MGWLNQRIELKFAWDSVLKGEIKDVAIYSKHVYCARQWVNRYVKLRLITLVLPLRVRQMIVFRRIDYPICLAGPGKLGVLLTLLLGVSSHVLCPWKYVFLRRRLIGSYPARLIFLVFWMDDSCSSVCFKIDVFSVEAMTWSQKLRFPNLCVPLLRRYAVVSSFSRLSLRYGHILFGMYLRKLWYYGRTQGFRVKFCVNALVK